MRSISAIILPVALMIIATPATRGQAQQGEPSVLGKTSLGRSQNDDRDLANSLVGAPQKFGKGEKKSQVNAAELKSKSIKDATFGGSLLNEGIGAAAPKLDASKEHAAPSEEKPSSKTTSTEQTASTSEQPASSERAPAGLNQPRISESGFSFSNLSQTATLGDELGQSEAGVTAGSTSKPAANSNSSNDAPKKDQSGQEKSAEKPVDH